MDYSDVFVCLMGMGTVFFGLTCLIGLTALMGRICSGGKDTPPVTPAAASAVTEPKREELVAAISAAIAEELGTDITGIRIRSMRKL